MRNIIILVVILALLTGGCDRYIETEGLEFSLPEAPPVPLSVTALHLSESIMITWEIADTVANMSFNVYYPDSLEDGGILWENTSIFSSTITGLVNGRQYYFMVAAVMPDGLEGYKSDPVATSPGLLSATINNGDEYTSSRNVSITFIVPVIASLMQVSEDPLFADAVWRSYASIVSFELSAGDDTKHIYARFRFADGSETGIAEAVSDSIILDTETHIDSVYYTPIGETFSAGDFINFYVRTSENGGEGRISFPGQSALTLAYNEGLSNPAGDIYIYSRNYEIPAGLELVDGEVSGGFIDAAGNNAAVVNAPALLNISNPPTPVTLVAVTVSSSEIRLNWSQSIDNDFAAYQVYRGSNGGVTNNTDPITVIESRATITYTDEELTAGMEYFYIIYVYDKTGLTAASNVVSATTLSGPGPTGLISP